MAAHVLKPESGEGGVFYLGTVTQCQADDSEAKLIVREGQHGNQHPRAGTRHLSSGFRVDRGDDRDHLVSERLLQNLNVT